MKGLRMHSFRTTAYALSVSLLAAALVFGQDSTGGWKRVGDAPAAPDQNTISQNAGAPEVQAPPAHPPGDPNQASPNQGPLTQPPPPGYGASQGGYGPPPNGQMAPPQGNYQTGYGNYGYQQPPAPQPVPATLTIPAGTYITVRVNQLLSSDRNQTGDAFSATLVQPVVVNGVVVAEPGQTIGGRVAEAVKAGHIEGVARLGLQLTTLTLVDGQQLPIQCQLISRSGPTSVGQDAGTIAGTTAVGAAIGAAAGWGRGAAIGAGAGAAAGIIGVLVTRGHPSIVTPEQVLTFKLEAPVTVSTTNAPQAFRYIMPNEYEQQPYGGAYSGGGGYPAYSAYAAAAPAPYYYGYPYPYYGWGYPWYWGGVGFYWGPGYWGRGYWGRGYWGGRYYGGFAGHAVVGGGHIAGGAVGHAVGGGARR